MTIATARALSGEAETRHWRPSFHFTPRENWINDPNGLVYFEGEYHLFYQYNPHGKDWGHMSWGHAVSSDLLVWTELPVAMPERDYMIFSGCALVDRDNCIGVETGGEPALVAIYTAHRSDPESQVQNLAYSTDRGRTWIDHPANPVIDRGLAHFRDPKVFWHAATGAWVMVVALPREHKVAIYRSANLLDWQLASEFGPAGKTGGQWECPDLLSLRVEGEDRSVWMLKVDVDKDFIGSVNGAQIFFGTFDGFAFAAFDEAGQPGDFGADFYAAQSWSDLPEAGGDPIWLAWMSTHQSGPRYPTHPWRGAMTLPRSLSARQEAGRWHLQQRPVMQWDDAMRSAVGRDMVLASGQGEALCASLAALGGEIRLTGDSATRAEFLVGDPGRPALRIVLDGARKVISIERRATTWDAPIVFEEPMHASWQGERAEIRLLFDRQSVEIFVPDEGLAMTACFFAPGDAALAVISHGDALEISAVGFRR